MKTSLLTKSFSALRVLVCAGAFLAASQTTRAAEQVDVYLTKLKFGTGKSLHASSKTRFIDAAAKYEYTLSGKIRGTPGTKLAKIVKVGTTLDQFLLSLSLNPAEILTGTFNNPNPDNALPVTVLEKEIKGSRDVKDFGTVKFSFKILAQILESGECVLDVYDVKIKTDPKLKLGSIKFSKGSVLNIKVIP